MIQLASFMCKQPNMWKTWHILLCFYPFLIMQRQLRSVTTLVTHSDV